MTKRWNHWTDKDQKHAAALYRATKNYTETAKLMGRSKRTVHYHLSRAGVIVKTDRREDASDHFVPPAHRLELREKLLAAQPRDLTGHLMGDPPMGFSAWERR